jgi:hypothetical protein
MPTLAQLQAAVSGLLNAAGATGALQLNSNTRERAFEAYIFGLVLQAARQAGAAVEVWGINSGQNPNPLVFRGGPGRLGSSTQDFAYGYCVLNGHEFEVHVDVEYQGSSGAVHEIDVSIVDSAHAEAIRGQSRRLPSTRFLRGALECKFYSSTLGVSLGRAFVGLISDCGQLAAGASFVTNGTDAGLASYLHQKSRPEPYFETTPLWPANANRFVSVVEQALRKWTRVG